MTGTGLFIGRFGPRRVATIVLALILLNDEAVPGRQDIFGLAMLTVGLSVLCHGLSARAATRWLAAGDRAKR